MGSTPTTGIKLSPLAVSRLGGLVLFPGVEGSNSPFPPQRDANQPGGLFARARETPTGKKSFGRLDIPAYGRDNINRKSAATNG